VAQTGGVPDGTLRIVPPHATKCAGKRRPALLLLVARQLLQLLQREDRPVLTDVLVAQVAAAAQADPALHPRFQGRDDVFLGELQFRESLENELDHDGRSAGSAPLP